MTLYNEGDVNTTNVNPGFETRLRGELEDMRERGVLKELLYLMGPQGPVVDIDGYGETINLCSNNYLGLAADPDVMRAVKDGTDRYGAGTASVRFICGTFDIHRELESRIADFLETPASITYTSAWNAAEGLFAPLLGSEDVIISDRLNHACIIDGMRLSRAQRKIYEHLDMDSLKEALESSRDARHRLVITDGIFSMEGEIAPLPAIRELCDRYDAVMAIDDSHATGVLGETGRGTPEHFGMHGEIDIITSTLGKALGGGSGGFTTGRGPIIELLRQRSRPYLFSNSLPPPLVAAGLKVFELLSEGADLRERLARNTTCFRDRMTAAGFDIKPGIHPIVAIMLYEAPLARDMAAALLEEGIYVIGFSYPVVPKGQARIRVQLSAGHSLAQVEQAVDAFTRVGRSLGVI